MPESRMEILILDDDAAVRHSLVDYFEDLQWHPIPFADAESALASIAENHPQAAVVDIRLSGMSGDAFIRQANSLCPEMIYVICTGSPDFGLADDLEALPQVSRQIFLKPVQDLSALKDEISRLVHTIRGIPR